MSINFKTTNPSIVEMAAAKSMGSNGVAQQYAMFNPDGSAAAGARQATQYSMVGATGAHVAAAAAGGATAAPVRPIAGAIAGATLGAGLIPKVPAPITPAPITPAPIAPAPATPAPISPAPAAFPAVRTMVRPQSMLTPELVARLVPRGLEAEAPAPVGPIAGATMGAGLIPTDPTVAPVGPIVGALLGAGLLGPVVTTSPKDPPQFPSGEVLDDGNPQRFAQGLKGETLIIEDGVAKDPKTGEPATGYVVDAQGELPKPGAVDMVRHKDVGDPGTKDDDADHAVGYWVDEKGVVRDQEDEVTSHVTYDPKAGTFHRGDETLGPKPKPSGERTPPTKPETEPSKDVETDDGTPDPVVFVRGSYHGTILTPEDLPTFHFGDPDRDRSNATDAPSDDDADPGVQDTDDLIPFSAYDVDGSDAGEDGSSDRDGGSSDAGDGSTTAGTDPASDASTTAGALARLPAYGPIYDAAVAANPKCTTCHSEPVNAATLAAAKAKDPNEVTYRAIQQAFDREALGLDPVARAELALAYARQLAPAGSDRSVRANQQRATIDRFRIAEAERARAAGAVDAADQIVRPSPTPEMQGVLTAVMGMSIDGLSFRTLGTILDAFEAVRPAIPPDASDAFLSAGSIRERLPRDLENVDPRTVRSIEQIVDLYLGMNEMAPGSAAYDAERERLIQLMGRSIAAAGGDPRALLAIDFADLTPEQRDAFDQRLLVFFLDTAGRAYDQRADLYGRRGWEPDSTIIGDDAAFLSELLTRDPKRVSDADLLRGAHEAGNDEAVLAFVKKELARRSDALAADLFDRFIQTLSRQPAAGRVAIGLKELLASDITPAWIREAVGADASATSTLGVLQSALRAMSELAARLRRFEGSGDELARAYLDGLSSAAGHLQHAQRKVERFDESQHNWVRGIRSAISAAVAAIAATILTGGAAVPFLGAVAFGTLAGAATRVGLNLTDPLYGEHPAEALFYGVPESFISAVTAGGGAAAMRPVAAAIQTAAWSSRAAKVAHFAAWAGVTAAEGAVDGFFTAFVGGIQQGLSPKHALEQAIVGLLIGGGLGPILGAPFAAYGLRKSGRPVPRAGIDAPQPPIIGSRLDPAAPVTRSNPIDGRLVARRDPSGRIEGFSAYETLGDGRVREHRFNLDGTQGGAVWDGWAEIDGSLYVFSKRSDAPNGHFVFLSIDDPNVVVRGAARDMKYRHGNVIIESNVSGGPNTPGLQIRVAPEFDAHAHAFWTPDGKPIDIPFSPSQVRGPDGKPFASLENTAVVDIHGGPDGWGGVGGVGAAADMIERELHLRNSGLANGQQIDTVIVRACLQGEGPVSFAQLVQNELWARGLPYRIYAPNGPGVMFASPRDGFRLLRPDGEWWTPTWEPTPPIPPGYPLDLRIFDGPSPVRTPRTGAAARIGDDFGDPPDDFHVNQRTTKSGPESELPGHVDYADGWSLREGAGGRHELTAAKRPGDDTFHKATSNEPNASPIRDWQITEDGRMVDPRSVLIVRQHGGSGVISEALLERAADAYRRTGATHFVMDMCHATDNVGILGLFRRRSWASRFEEALRRRTGDNRIKVHSSREPGAVKGNQTLDGRPIEYIPAGQPR